MYFCATAIVVNYCYCCFATILSAIGSIVDNYTIAHLFRFMALAMIVTAVVVSLVVATAVSIITLIFIVGAILIRYIIRFHHQE